MKASGGKGKNVDTLTSVIQGLAEGTIDFDDRRLKMLDTATKGIEMKKIKENYYKNLGNRGPVFKL